MGKNTCKASQKRCSKLTRIGRLHLGAVVPSWRYKYESVAWISYCSRLQSPWGLLVLIRSVFVPEKVQKEEQISVFTHTHTHTHTVRHLWPQLPALGLIVGEASLCVHTSTAGWILLAQAAAANNSLTHANCSVCVLMSLRVSQCDQTTVFFVYWEDVLLLKASRQLPCCFSFDFLFILWHLPPLLPRPPTATSSVGGLIGF